MSEERPLGSQQERYLVNALTNAFGNERNNRTVMTVWATQRQLGSLVERGYFEQTYPSRGRYGPNWKGRQRSESWTLTEKGVAAARVVRCKWQLCGWGKAGPPRRGKATEELELIIDDPMPEALEK